MTTLLAATAYADTSYFPIIPSGFGLAPAANALPVYDTASSATPNGEYVSQEEADRAISFGMFKLTSYCTGHCCNGKWGNVTVLGGPITPGRTIAVD